MPKAKNLNSISPDVIPVSAPSLFESEDAYESLIHANERLEILSESARLLLSSDRPERIVQSICERVMRHLDCHIFFNFLVLDGKRRLHLNACSGVTDDVVRQMEYLDFGVNVCGCVAESGKKMIAQDIPNNPDSRTELVKSFGMTAYACHPLIYQGQTIGTLSFGTKSRTNYRPEELDLMASVANLAATAMARKQSEDRLRQKDDQIREAYTEVIAAVTGGKLVLMTGEEIRAELGEPIMENVEVASASELSLARDRLSLALESGFSRDGTVATKAMLPFSEALTNAVKHGGGGRFQLRRLGEAAQICIQDDGPGINFNNLPRAMLTPGFSTCGTLGMGFTIMLNASSRMLLSTRPGETIVVMEMTLAA